MLFEVVRATAREAPERPAVISAGRGQLDYGECLARSAAVAVGLRERGIERFGCVFESAADTVVALCAAAAAGSEACVYPRDAGSGGHARLAARFGHGTILADTAGPLEDVETVTLAALQEGGDRMPPGLAERFPVLILTTGTTGEPLAARHDWGHLLHAQLHPDPRPGIRWLLAYNPYQFGAIQVLLHVLASGGTLVEPISRQPGDAIAAIRDHRVTHVSATPTFWRLLSGRLDRETAAQLPLEQMTLGGEAVPEALIERLRKLFPSAHISQIYGSTESGTAVSVRDGHSGLPLSVLNRDENADVQLRIVDGELQMRSRIGMLGYLDDSDDQRGRWRRTGDLVEVRDGRIYFVGRTTEIINVGGAKIHPLPVEERISEVDGVELVAVYGRPNAVTGQIVAADVVAAPGADTARVEHGIRNVCQDLPAAARPRRIRFVPALDLRGSKVSRHEV